MKYLGSKRRIAKYILPIILKDREQDQWYVEPFVGGDNMIDKVEGNRIGAGINKEAIEALLSIRDHVQYLPKDNKEFTEADHVHDLPKDNKEFTEADYVCLKNDMIQHNHKGYLSFICAFGANQWGSWRRGKSRVGFERDYIKEGYRNAVKQSPNLQGVKLYNSPYNNLEIPKNSIIYCDPPYQGTYNYKVSFDHEMFWQWCREKTIQGHSVFISEYKAPEDFSCIWERELNITCARYKVSKSLEKLFIFDPESAELMRKLGDLY